MNIVIFGVNGMLGNYMAKYLSQWNKVTGLTRADVDLTTITRPEQLNEYLDERPDLIINCAGAIKPCMDNLGPAIKINSIWPHILLRYCHGTGKTVKMIHISTDCVFYGDKGSYSESDMTNPADKYGLSKLLGEPTGGTIIRTSIIGEEKLNGRSLLEWVRSNSGKTITGYTNHFWNGVSCLRLAMTIQHMINHNKFWIGIRHIHSNHVLSKYELLCLVNEVYDMDINVEPAYMIGNCCDRTLDSNDIFNVVLEHPSLRDQLIEQKRFGV